VVRQDSLKSWTRGLATAATLAYMLAVSVYFIDQRVWPTPDFLIPPLILIALFCGRGWEFVADWWPFLAILMGYEAFRGVADDINSRVHYTFMIDADRWMAFGHVPTVWLQDRFFDPNHVHWYDYLATALHATHYAVSVCFGFVLWLRNRGTYWRYATALIVMFAAGIGTEFLYPAAPPWMASLNGYLPPVERVIGPTVDSFTKGSGFTLAYHYFSANDVAALPSLHAALPLLLALIAIDLNGRKAWLSMAYPLVGGVAWVYLGEHYVVDVIAGWLYAYAAFLLCWVWGPGLLRRSGLAAVGRTLQRRFSWQRPLPAWPLGAAVVAVAIYVWFNPIVQMPFQPEPAPEPAAAATLASLNDLAPVACDGGASLGHLPDEMLARYNQQFAAYLQSLDTDSCLAITASRQYEPLSQTGLDILKAFPSYGDAIQLTPDDDGGWTYAIVGLPSAALAQVAGFGADQPVALVLRVDNTDNETQVEDVARQLSAVALKPDIK
jgi:hypothetical protein